VLGAWANLSTDKGLRLFNPFRDLPAVAVLLLQAFGDEMALESAASARALRLVSRFPFLSWMWLGADAWFDSDLVGFVWLDDGRIVGNADIAPAASGRQWILSNVAVEPQYRGRGIATALVRACIGYASREGASTVLLQVWTRNEAARRLYEKEGFRPLSSVARLVRQAEPALALPAAQCPEGWQWRDCQASDVHRLSRVAGAMLPYEAQAVRPLSVAAFDITLGERWRRLGRIAGRPWQARQRVLIQGEGVLGGLALQRTAGTWRLVAVLPQVEAPLAAECLAVEAVRLSGLAGGSAVICDVPDHLGGYRRALEAAGFAYQDSLMQMSLTLS